jgi:hypothetical protein
MAVYQSKIYAVGWTSGVMNGTTNAGKTDVFIRKITVYGDSGARHSWV